MKNQPWLVIACAAWAVWAAACDSDDDGARDSGTTRDSGAKDSGARRDAGGGHALRVATYNAGLLDSVGYVPQRAPLVAQALADLDVDLMCVQEVWQQEHWDALVDASADTRPHVLRFDPQPGVMGLCTPDEFGPVRTCAEANCSDAGASGLVNCTTTNCIAEVSTLSTSCVSCLLDKASTGDFQMIEDACVGAPAMSSGHTTPEDRSYFVGGSFGIGVLSKLPFAESDELVLDSSGTRRGVLYARVDVPEIGALSVFCTHLTPRLLGAYDGSYDSWEDENAAHVQALIDWVDEKTAGGEPALVLGDLNAGPDLAAKGIKGELAENYAKLPAAGFADPFLDGPNAACTFCADDALVIPFDTGVDSTIDHVLVRDLDAKVTVQRILTDEVAITNAADAGSDAPQRLPRSDHYGLQAVITP
jgi:endonuclease/exonuclease/phosphatase family metal-dependent hydrolase